MARVKGGVTSKARHKKIIKLAKGFRGRAKNCYRVAIEKVAKASQYAYRDRRTRKRNFRALWIIRINAAVRELGTSYSRFIQGLSKANIAIDRKILSDLAISNPQSLAQLVEQSEAALSA